jgi:glycine cleavage system transcriptional repressor
MKSHSRVLLSISGLDQPGIVVSVTEALARKGWNLEDATMSILQRYFTVMVMVAVGSDVTPQQVISSLHHAQQKYALQIEATICSDSIENETAELLPWSIFVHGSDRPGIVHAVATEIFKAGGNIVDLVSRPGGRKGDAVYIMTIRAMIPSGKPSDMFHDSLSRLAVSEGIDCSARLDSAFIL